MNTIQTQVLTEHRLPGVMEFIDGTHVRIFAPTTDKEDYMDRKKSHPMNAHDSRVFKPSQLYKDLSEGWAKGRIVGDSAYAAKHFLIKSLDTVSKTEKRRYNKAISAARSNIECAFGILKRRLHILQAECSYDPEIGKQIIVTCAILHNYVL
ncbi:hypothetical protein ANCDUO_02172 [Ancylostoma duodenale]|uniref:DDE Tnp4 domain-containing protein n=1 Tax=Ancylostoma duodenale TaxID=51022 RepID=A0A0C2H171_9BILA|nr:hypothetical protein ANCDUO_02172 [Ancylostoma duodenale]